MPTDMNQMVINLTAVIVAVTDDRPRVLVVKSIDDAASPALALPSGPFDPVHHDSMETALQ